MCVYVLSYLWNKTVRNKSENKYNINIKIKVVHTNENFRERDFILDEGSTVNSL